MLTPNSAQPRALPAGWWIPIVVLLPALAGTWLVWEVVRRASPDSFLQILALLAGSVVTILLAASVGLWRFNLHQARQLAAANAELEKQRERFELAVRGSQAGLWDWETSTDIVWYAPRFRELLGYEGDDVDSMPPLLETFNRHIHPDDFEPTWEQVRRHLSDQVPYDTEYRLRTRAGAYRWFRARGASVRDVQGQATRMAGSIQDVTDRKLAEQRLHEAAEKLRRSNHELQQFASIASHDLQEPLRSVGNFAGLLKGRYGDQLNEEAKDWLDRIVNAAQRMSSLVRDLLAFSRVQSRAEPFQSVDCNVVVDEVMRGLSAAIDESQATVTRDDLPTLFADRIQLGQLFQNLIVNAIKFRGEEPLHVHVGVEQQNGQWRFSIRDNGIGIDPQYQEQIFEVFRRLHRGEEYPGTGIGLAICRRVVHRHGGDISVESQPGEGSTFFFTIPVGGPDIEFDN